MSQYQLPALKNEKHFEEFICDLFNEINNTTSFQCTDFQRFGVKGQAQKGIDIVSAQSKTVIQCKLKDLRKKDDIIRKQIEEDIKHDLELSSGIQFGINRFIFVSTFRDDAYLQEFAIKLTQESKLPFTFEYWGWDTLSKYAEEYDAILKKYFPQFSPKKAKQPKKAAIELPENALGRDLNKKNYVNYLSKRYGDWKQLQFDREGKGEKFNWASHNKSLMNKYHASGINYINIGHFDDLVNYLSDKIDKTVFGRNQRAKGRRNFSSFEEHIQGIDVIVD